MQRNLKSNGQYDLKLLAVQFRHVTDKRRDSYPCVLQSARHEKGQTATRTIRGQQKLISKASKKAIDVNLRIGHRRKLGNSSFTW